MSASSSERTYVAFDIESGGRSFDAPVLAVGMCWGNSSKTYKRRWCIKVDRSEIEPECFKEFWAKNERVLCTIESEAIAADTVWTEVVKAVDGLYALHGDNLRIVSDNPAFDISIIDHWLCKLGKRKYSIRYSPEGSYHSISDPTEQMRFFSDKSGWELHSYQEGFLHTHLPDEDAEYMLRMQIYLDSYVPPPPPPPVVLAAKRMRRQVISDDNDDAPREK